MNTLEIRRHALHLLAATMTLAAAACTATSASNVHEGAPGRAEQEPLVQSGAGGSEKAAVACGSLQCNISGSVWSHIQTRHCSGCAVGDKSAFVPAYCTDVSAAVSLCNAIKGAPGCVAVVQPNGNIAATATLGNDVGIIRTDCATTTKTGTVIFSGDGQSVVTQFPGTP